MKSIKDSMFKKFANNTMDDTSFAQVQGGENSTSTGDNEYTSLYGSDCTDGTTDVILDSVETSSEFDTPQAPRMGL